MTMLINMISAIIGKTVAYLTIHWTESAAYE
jgi:TRAP-type mannitol/chloroaromatic compound transport system permease small subunit